MGFVWRAMDPTLHREVAIKVLRDEIARDPKFAADFLQEARNAAAISHPHIAQVHLVGDTGGQYYIVMELLRGRSLRQILETDGPLDEERALDITIQVAEALRAAYKQQMIHGDIKPANIFITEDQGAKVLDFGLAKLANVEVIPSGGGIWGSPYYISPERVGQRAEDFRSDVYSLGATLFHAIAGRPPFDAEDPAQLALKRLSEKPPLLRDINPRITAKTEKVVNKMLNKSILMRYLDYDALLKDLNEAKTEATAQRLGVDLHAMEHLQPPTPVAAPSPLSKELPIIIGVLIAMVAMVIVAVSFVLRQNKHTPPKPPIVHPVPTPPKPENLPKPEKPPEATNQAMVAYWPLDGKVDDASGSGYPLSLVGDPTFVQSHLGQALALNGVDQYAQTTAAVLDTSKPFSVAVWAYWSGGGKGYEALLSQDGANISCFYLQRGRNGKLRMVMRDEDSKTSSVICVVEWDTVLAPNTWYHFAGIYTGSEVKLYANGMLVGSKPFNSGFATSGAFIVGAGKWGTRDDYWGGMIAGVKVFNYVIFDADVATLAVPPPVVVSNAGPSAVSTSAVTTTPNTNATLPGTGTKSSLSNADEEKLARDLVASLTNLWSTYDFQTAFTKYSKLNQQLVTREGKRVLQVPLAIATRLADFKTQLIADFQRERYFGPSLTKRNNTFLSSGTISSATDEDVITSTQYGELTTPWADIQPESLAKAADYYANAFAAKEPPEKQAKRHFQIMVFCKQFGLDCLSRQHSADAIRLDPGLNEETKLIWGKIPTPCSSTEQQKPAATPKQYRRRKPSS